MTAPQNSDIETRRIPENQLEEYFTKFTKHFLLRDTTNRIDVEVLGADLGDQYEAENATIFGITYDPKEVWAAEESDGFIKAIEVVREDGTREVARVKRGALVTSAESRPSSAE